MTTRWFMPMSMIFWALCRSSQRDFRIRICMFLLLGGSSGTWNYLFTNLNINERGTKTELLTSISGSSSRSHSPSSMGVSPAVTPGIISRSGSMTGGSSSSTSLLPCAGVSSHPGWNALSPFTTLPSKSTFISSYSGKPLLRHFRTF